MFHPMDPMGQFIHYFEKRFNIIEEKLGIENTENSIYNKDNNFKELNISTKEISDIIEKQKNVQYNREWNGIVKNIKKGAEDGNEIIIYFNIKKYQKEMMKKLKKLGFDLEQKNKLTSAKDAVTYIVTIGKEQK